MEMSATIVVVCRPSDGGGPGPRGAAQDGDQEAGAGGTLSTHHLQPAATGLQLSSHPRTTMHKTPNKHKLQRCEQ